jgi:hypothetical protein
MDAKKIANNMLEFLIDPTVFPVQQRLYFRPEEVLRNESFESAKADSYKAYGDQRKNSDFYPSKNRTREAAIMDRKTIVASMDILSQQFTDENDPMAKDLRTMAFCVAKLPEEEYTARLASEDEVSETDVEASDIEAKKKKKKKKVEMAECPKCGTKVLKQTGYCLKCKKKTLKASEEVVESAEPVEASEEVLDGMWSKEAAEAVQEALISDVLGGDVGDMAEEAPVPVMDAPKEEAAPKKEKKEEKKEKAPVMEEAPAGAPAEEAPEAPKTASIKQDLKSVIEKIKGLDPKVLKDIGRAVSTGKAASEDVTSGVGSKFVGLVGLLLALAAAAHADPAQVGSQMANKAPDQVATYLDSLVQKADEVELKSRGTPRVQEVMKEINDAIPESNTKTPGAAPKQVVLSSEAPVVPEEKKAEQVVDTNILAYEGIELNTPMMDEVSLTADEKSRLDQLFL